MMDEITTYVYNLTVCMVKGCFCQFIQEGSSWTPTKRGCKVLLVLLCTHWLRAASWRVHTVQLTRLRSELLLEPFVPVA